MVVNGNGGAAYVEGGGRLLMLARQLIAQDDDHPLRDSLEKAVERLDLYADLRALDPVELAHAVDIALGIITEDEIVRLAALDPGQFELQRKRAVRRLGWRLGALDREIRTTRRNAHPRGAIRPNGSNTRTVSEKTPRAQGEDDRSREGSSGGTVRVDTVRVDELHAAARDVIENVDPLGLVDEQIKRMGYAGDTRPALLTYVALSSRHQPRPLNLHHRADAASGKNFTVNTALALHPSSAFYLLSASSSRTPFIPPKRFRTDTYLGRG